MVHARAPSPSSIVSFHVFQRGPTKRAQRSKFAGSERLPDRLSGKCLAYNVTGPPPTCSRLFRLFLSRRFPRFLVPLCPRLSSARRRGSSTFFFSSFLSLPSSSSAANTAFPSRAVSEGKKTWSTSFVRGFLSPPSVRPIKGKVLVPGTGAMLASPGTPASERVTPGSSIPTGYRKPLPPSEILPQLNLRLKNLFPRVFFSFFVFSLSLSLSLSFSFSVLFAHEERFDGFSVGLSREREGERERDAIGFN